MLIALYQFPYVAERICVSTYICIRGMFLETEWYMYEGEKNLYQFFLFIWCQFHF